MKLTPEGSFLRSHVARRVFVLFVLCALVPIGTLALVAFRSVTAALEDQARRRLHDDNRAAVNGIFERLDLLEERLRVVGQLVAAGARPDAIETRTQTGPRRLTTLALIRDGEPVAAPSGPSGVDPPTLSGLTDAQRSHLEEGRMLLLAGRRSGPAAPVTVARRVRTPQGGPAILAGGVDPMTLWLGRTGALPADNELCVLGPSEPLFCTPGLELRAADLSGRITELRRRPESERTDAGQLELAVGERVYLANYRDMPLDFRFGYGPLTAVLAVPRDEVLSPIRGFQRSFPLIVLLAFVVVLLLSSIQIRRNLVPLERLHEGTRRIAARQFDTRVEVESDDEFQDLAESFNEMAERLGRQFEALSTSADIDRSVLSAVEIEAIAATVVRRVPDVVGCGSVWLVVADDDGDPPRSARAWSDDEEPSRSTELRVEDLENLSAHPDGRWLEGDDPRPPLLGERAPGHGAVTLLLPLFVDGAVAGALVLGFDRRPEDQETSDHARRLANQVAVAIANARLVDDLEELGWGALQSLARAIDEKSPWTAGHSERTTRMALRIGRRYGLDEDQLETLRRGGLIHDIGKIGIPAEILDKDGRLDETEFALIREHPERGARILEPVEAYADLVPLVLEHHERYDGGGYPRGLAGAEIHLLARVLAVADVYDALTSDRPYRDGLPPERVVEIIAEDAGTHFDPRVVQAFLAVAGPAPS